MGRIHYIYIKQMLYPGALCDQWFGRFLNKA